MDAAEVPDWSLDLNLFKLFYLIRVRVRGLSGFLKGTWVRKAQIDWLHPASCSSSYSRNAHPL